MITFKNLALPAPSGCVVEIASRTGSERYNTLGQLLTDNRREKRVLDLRWNRMEPPILQQLFALLDGGVFFDITYPDPVQGEKTITCRCTDRGAKVWQYTDQPKWADVRLKLEER